MSFDKPADKGEAMDQYWKLDELSRDFLKELGNIGTGNAVTALSQMLMEPVDIEVPGLRIMKYQDCCSLLRSAEELMTGIMVGVTGDLKGVFLFLLDETFTKAVLDNVLGEEERNLLSLNEMERSLICEMGNIMCGSYICALSAVLDLKMDVTVPALSIDMGLALLSAPVAHYLEVSEDILVIDNIFRLGGKAFTGRILFLPEPEALEKMLQRLGE